MKILFLSRWYPYPADNGSKLRIASLLRGLAQSHDVTLISFVSSGQPTTRVSTPPGPTATHLVPYREFDPGSHRALAGYLSTRPRFLVDTYCPEMAKTITTILERERFDLVIASQTPMAAYYRHFHGIPAIFEEAELGIYWPYTDGRNDPVSLGRTLRKQLTWIKHTRFLARALKSFSACTVVSDIEKKMLESAVPRYRQVHVLPNSVEMQPEHTYLGHREQHSLIFTGALTYGPNRDAIDWFLDQILPRVIDRAPELRLTVTGDVGSSPPKSGPHVLFTGRVDDVHGLVARSAISIAPIRAGGGTRLKILEAMALGTPVVSTAKAAEGLDVEDGTHILIRDTPDAFADAILYLLAEPGYAQKMAGRARQLCSERYDTRLVIPRWLDLVERAAAA